jgi:hypothetical protein
MEINILKPAFFFVVVLFFACDQNKTPEEYTAFEKPASNAPEIRWKEEFDMLKNPYTNSMPKDIRRLELEEAANIPLREEIGLNAGNTYSFQGPNNIGGRCRAIAFDARYNGADNRVILAGGVSGGMFRSINGGQNWTRVSSLDNIHNVTSVAQDPRPGHQDTWYFGTGENLGNSAGATGGTYWGYGIYKSIDNGVTWNVLTSTTGGSQFSFDNRFDYVSRIAIDPTNGNVYAATLNTITLSTDGGNSWTIERGVFGGNTGGITDVAVTPTGIIYAAIPGRGLASVDNEGIWKKENGSWTRIAGGGSPAWFRTGTSLGRIVLGIAPSNPNLVYALYYNGTTSSCAGTPAPEADFGLYNNANGLWANLSANLPDEPGCLDGNDPFAVQGGYDLLVAVKPDNPNVVFIGGTNFYMSTDGFSTPNNTTRLGGYSSPAGFGFNQASHPDYHAAVFAPHNPDILFTGTDGGISETTITSLPPFIWTERNTNFNTLQYYYVAIDPTPGSSFFIGGAQDNGTIYRNAGANSHLIITGGDGVSVGISANNTNHYVGSQRGTINRRASGLNPGLINARLTPGNLSANRLFVTLFHLDPVNSTVIYYADFNKLYRNARADTVSLNALPADRMEEVTGVASTIGNVSLRSFSTSWGPYNSATSKFYFGTNDGRIFRLDDPRDCPFNTPPVQINSGAGMPTGTIMGLAVNPRSADTLVAVYSNYGIVNIWFCGNATSLSPTWTAIEGNLTLPSIRSAAIVAGPEGVDYYVGTSTGLYSTTSLNGNATVWTKEGANSIGNAVVVDLKLRTADNRLLVGTHGNGMFTTDVILPVRWGNFYGQIVNGNVALKWETLTEVNNKGFEVQKSVDGTSFEKIGYVQARGQSALRASYTFTDPSKLLRAQYYRIKQIDFDGRSSFSKVVKIALNHLPLHVTSVVNPMSTNLIFTLNDEPQYPVTVTLTDASGKVVFTQTTKANQGNTYRFNTYQLTNGMYYLKVQSGSFSETKKIIKR